MSLTKGKCFYCFYCSNLISMDIAEINFVFVVILSLRNVHQIYVNRFKLYSKTKTMDATPTPSPKSMKAPRSCAS